jgi:hypothetical protein
LPIAFWQDRANDTDANTRSHASQLQHARHSGSLGCLRRLPAAWLLEAGSGPQEEAFVMTKRQIYVRAVLNLFAQMPNVLPRCSGRDRALADQFFDRQIPFDIVETALLLGSARRIFRWPAVAPIYSLAYFEPIIEELLAERWLQPWDGLETRSAGVMKDADDPEPPF